MGTWGRGPFENDAAADFVVELKQSDAPELDVACALDDVRTAPRGEYLDLDEGQRCVAACALVAFAFNAGPVPQALEGLVAALQRDESLIDLSLAALPRVLDRKRSELADVVPDLSRFDALYDQLADLAEGDVVPEVLDLSAVFTQPHRH